MPDVATPPAPAALPAAAPASPAAPPNPAPLNVPAGDPMEELGNVFAGDDEPAAPKADAKLEAKTPEKKPEPPKPDDGKPAVERKGEKALREQLATVTTTLRAKEDSIRTLEARIADLDKRGHDTTTLSERLAQREKELEEHKSELWALKQETSPAFKKQWDVPIQNAINSAARDIVGLEIQPITDPDTGEIKTPARAATWDDFAPFLNLTRPQAIRAAKKMFGNEADIAIPHLNKIFGLDEDRALALKDEKEQSKSKKQAEEAEQIKSREAWNAASAAARKAFIDKNPDIYGDDPNDPEGNGVLQKTRAYYDTEPKTFQEAVAKSERMKLNAEAAPRLAHRNRKLTAEVAALKAQIEELKGSRPGPGGRRTTGAQAGGGEEKKTMAEELAESGIFDGNE